MEIARPSTGDLIAGISVALIAIPQSLAYAELAGVPAQIGLFASALPPLCAALFVSSKYLQTGPVALTALLTFGALSTIAEPGSAEYVRLAALLGGRADAGPDPEQHQDHEGAQQDHFPCGEFFH